MHNFKLYTALLGIMISGFCLNAHNSGNEILNFVYSVEPDRIVQTQDKPLEFPERKVAMQMVKDPDHNVVYLQFRLINFPHISTISKLKLNFDLEAFPYDESTLWEFNFGVNYDTPPASISTGSAGIEVVFENLEDYAFEKNTDSGYHTYTIGKPYGKSISYIDFLSNIGFGILPDIVVLLGGNYCDDVSDDIEDELMFSPERCNVCNTLYSGQLNYAAYFNKIKGSWSEVRTQDPIEITNDCKENYYRTASASVNEPRIYPNPANLEILFDGVNAIEEIQVVSMTGQLISSMQHDKALTYRIDVSRWSPGVYFAKLKSEDGIIETKKFIIARE